MQKTQRVHAPIDESRLIGEAEQHYLMVQIYKEEVTRTYHYLTAKEQADMVQFLVATTKSQLKSVCMGIDEEEIEV